MPLRRWMLVPALAASLALPLSGCTPESPEPTATKSAAHTPLFSSDEEALAAATKAYAAYLKVADAVMAAGGAGSSRFRNVATGQALDQALASAKEFRTEGVHSAGISRFDSARLQSPVGSDDQAVTIYLCDDTSQVDVLDESGKSIVSADRATRVPFLVTTEPSSEDTLVVSKRNHWSGENFC